MSTQAYEIIEFVSSLYNDPITYTNGEKDADGVRVTESQWIEFINDACRVISSLRPDQSAVTASIKLSSGTKQDLPSDAMRLIDVTRNMGSDGNTPGNAIREVDREIFDLMLSSWHEDEGATEIENYMYDLRHPKEFYVYPPVSSTADVYVEIIYTQSFTPITSASDNVPVNDVLVPAIKEWCLYRAYTIDSDSVNNTNLGLHYYKSFFQLLGTELKTGVEIEPPTED